MSLTACGWDFFNSRQKQLETITQRLKVGVKQEATFRKQVQEASQWLEEAQKQVGWPLTDYITGTGSLLRCP